jgi:hypothetical protein
MPKSFGYVAHLKINRFVFEAATTAPSNTPPPQGASAGGGGLPNVASSDQQREFALQWSRCNAPQLLHRTQFWPRSELLQQPLIDFQSHAAAFPVDEESLSQMHQRVIIFQLVSREARAFGGARAATPVEVVVASGTIDLAKFLDVPSKPYALTMESNFFAVGKLHFNFFMAPAQEAASFQEQALVLYVEHIDEVASANPPQLVDGRCYQIKVSFDGAEPTRTPMHECANGIVTFRHTVPVRPCAKVKFMISDEEATIGKTAVRMARLTSGDLPKNFTLPVALDGGAEARLMFTVREELVTRNPQDAADARHSNLTPINAVGNRPEGQTPPLTPQDGGSLAQGGAHSAGDLPSLAHQAAASFAFASASLIGNPLGAASANTAAATAASPPNQSLMLGQAVPTEEHRALQHRYHVLEQMLHEAHDRLFLQETYIAELLAERALAGEAHDRSSQLPQGRVPPLPI